MDGEHEHHTDRRTATDHTTCGETTVDSYPTHASAAVDRADDWYDREAIRYATVDGERARESIGYSKRAIALSGSGDATTDADVDESTATEAIRRAVAGSERAGTAVERAEGAVTTGTAAAAERYLDAARADYRNATAALAEARRALAADGPARRGIDQSADADWPVRRARTGSGAGRRDRGTLFRPGHLAGVWTWSRSRRWRKTA